MWHFQIEKVSESDELSVEPVVGGTMSPRPYKIRMVPRK